VDGVTIQILLHVIDGIARGIEVYKEDLLPVIQFPAPAELRLFSPPYWRREGETPKIILKRWKPGLQKISFTTTLRVKAGLSLTSAKECVDRLLGGEEVVVALTTVGRPASLAEAIAELGAHCQIETK